jgi:uncharacterized repeat protein (TIGR01451 family)
MKRMWKSLAAATLAIASSAAAQPAAIETHLEARKVVRAADGKETFAAAENARPGDVIEYVATDRNTGKQAVKNLAATLPIPANTEYVAGSARPADAKASIDAATYAGMPLVRKVVRDGRTIEEQVPIREYRSLRWFAGELGGDKTASFTARVRVIDDQSPSEPGNQGGGK